MNSDSLEGNKPYLGLQEGRSRKKGECDFWINRELGVFTHGAIPAIEIVEIFDTFLDHISWVVAKANDSCFALSQAFWPYYQWLVSLSD